MHDSTELLINDVACMDRVYVDGAITEGICDLGANILLPFFCWTPQIDGNQLTMVRTPKLVIVGPRSMLMPQSSFVCAADLKTPSLLPRSQQH
jgi:hypothetical protein